MSDLEKTKEVLVQELEELRQRLASHLADLGGGHNEAVDAVRDAAAAFSDDVPAPDVVIEPGPPLVFDAMSGDEVTGELRTGSGLRKLIDAMPFYALLVDEAHTIVAANRTFLEIVGRTSQEAVGARCPNLVHGVHRFPGCPLEKSLKSGKAEEEDLFDAESGSWVQSSIYPTPFQTARKKRIYLHMVRDITHRVKMEEDNRRNYEIQVVLNDLLEISLKQLSLTDQLDLFLERIVSIPWLSVKSQGSISLVEDEPEVLVLKAHRGLAPDLLEMCARVPFGRCLCGRAAQGTEVVYAGALDDRHDHTYDSIVEHGHYCTPLLSSGVVIGVLNLYLESGHEWEEAEVRFLKSVAGVLAGVVERKRAEELLAGQLEAVERTMHGTVEAIGRTLEVRDPYTAGHQERVATLATAIAVEMGLEPDRVRGVNLAASIHDIGKISVPAEILSKPGRLTDIEFSMIKTHAQVGYQILKDIEFSWPIADMVHQHHERFTGGGYPQGLAGDEILLEARILCIADVVEAIASHRPYRASLGLDIALEEVEKCRGTFFDPEVADACLRLFRERSFSFS